MKLTPIRCAARSRARRALPARRCAAASARCAGRLRPPVAAPTWFPKVLRARRDAEPRGAASSSAAQGDGAGVQPSRTCRRRFAATAPPMPDTRRVPRAGARTASPTSALDGRRPGRAAAASSRSPSCARCRRARRSRATIASRAGARSANGRACGCARCSTSVQAEAGGALRRVPLRRSDGRQDGTRSRTTRASTSTTPTTRRRSSRTSSTTQPLPVANGAPLRLRVERQLGYKHAKYVMRHRARRRASRASRGGKGGYWEDQGYQWYAGI